jgi:LPS export ABC transporter protein LptC
MVLRIEYILLIAFAILFWVIAIEEPKSIEATESNCTKEVFFKNFSLIELTPTGVENHLSSSSAIKYSNRFEFEDINITYKNSHHLFAHKGSYEKDKVYLEDNVSLTRDDGLSFMTYDLRYSIKDKVAYTNRGFVMEVNESQIRGQQLHYDLALKKISADKIEASITVESP